MKSFCKFAFNPTLYQHCGRVVDLTGKEWYTNGYFFIDYIPGYKSEAFEKIDIPGPATPALTCDFPVGRPSFAGIVKMTRALLKDLPVGFLHLVIDHTVIHFRAATEDGESLLYDVDIPDCGFVTPELLLNMEYLKRLTDISRAVKIGLSRFKDMNLFYLETKTYKLHLLPMSEG